MGLTTKKARRGLQPSKGFFAFRGRTKGSIREGGPGLLLIKRAKASFNED